MNQGVKDTTELRSLGEAPPDDPMEEMPAEFLDLEQTN